MAGQYVEKEDLARAREMDLLTYKQTYDPYDLVKDKEGYYHLKSHDSLKINYHNGKWLWNWWAQGIGGRSALDYLMQVEGMGLVDAVEHLLGNVAKRAPVKPPEVKEEKKGLYIPERKEDERGIYEYLCDRRGIDEKIVHDFVERGEIYMTKRYGNIAFVGHDEEGVVKLVSLRGTRGDFKNTTAGSDRRYPFMARAEDFGVRNNVVHLFEAPIDMLSYATLMKQTGTDYKMHNLLSLCGIYQPKKENIAESKVPAALTQYINDVPYTKTVCLHLDTDGPGRLAAKALKLVLEKQGYKVYDQPPPEGYKDCNDFLQRGTSLIRPKEKEMEVER